MINDIKYMIDNVVEDEWKNWLKDGWDEALENYIDGLPCIIDKETATRYMISIKDKCIRTIDNYTFGERVEDVIFDWSDRDEYSRHIANDIYNYIQHDLTDDDDTNEEIIRDFVQESIEIDFETDEDYYYFDDYFEEEYGIKMDEVQ